MPRPVRIVFYAINGTGLGHLSRLLNLARAAKELLDVLGVPADFHLVTTSEAPQVAWDLPVYKLPSKSVVRAAGADAARFVHSAKLMVANLVANLSPDLLVLDTEPQGAFQDFVFLRGFAKATAFIDRHKDPNVAAREVYQRHLTLYDRILVPDDSESISRYPAPAEVKRKRRFIGRVHGFRPEVALDRQEVRIELGVQGDRRLVYLSAGGGGDGTAEDSLNALVDALSEDSALHLAIAYGPLYRGTKRRGPNITALAEPDLSRFFSGFDAAISAAGYNTFFELLAAEVPAVFFAQAKGMDRQDQRIDWGVAHGYCARFGSGYQHPGDCAPEQIRASLNSVLQGSLRDSIADALQARRPDQGAVTGATELLALIATIAGSPLERAEVMELGAWRRSWLASPGREFVPEATWTRQWRRRAMTRPDFVEARGEAASAFATRTSDEGINLEIGTALRRWQDLGLSAGILERLLVVWTSDPEAASCLEDSQRGLLDALEIFEATPDPVGLMSWLLAEGTARSCGHRIRSLSGALDSPSARLPMPLPATQLDPQEFEAWVATTMSEETKDATTYEG